MNNRAEEISEFETKIGKLISNIQAKKFLIKDYDEDIESHKNYLNRCETGRLNAINEYNKLRQELLELLPKYGEIK